MPARKKPDADQRGTEACDKVSTIGDLADQSVAAGSVELASTGMVVKSELDYDTWLGVGERLRTCEGGVLWWIGDWLNYGEKRYGEKYTQALETFGYAYQTLVNAKTVAEKIQFNRRRLNLTWAHHQDVAALPEPEQDELLSQSEKNNWTVKELRAAVRAKREPAKPPKNNDLESAKIAFMRLGEDDRKAFMEWASQYYAE